MAGISHLIQSNRVEGWVGLWGFYYDHGGGCHVVSDNWIEGALGTHWYCASNEITGNYVGEFLIDGDYSRIYNNYVMFRYTPDNSLRYPGGRDEGVGNVWSIPKTPGTNIVGGPYLGGNFWAMYNGADADGDGLGDTPQELWGSSDTSDELPLIGQAELWMSDGGNSPQGGAVSPQGRPFAVAQVKLEAGAL